MSGNHTYFRSGLCSPSPFRSQFLQQRLWAISFFTHLRFFSKWMKVLTREILIWKIFLFVICSQVISLFYGRIKLRFLYFGAFSSAYHLQCFLIYYGRKVEMLFLFVCVSILCFSNRCLAIVTRLWTLPSPTGCSGNLQAAHRSS